MRRYLVGIFILLAIGFSGCSTHSVAINKPGEPTTYVDHTQRDKEDLGVGIASQDIINMTDEMMRDMLTNEMIVSNNKRPKVVVDSRYFTNESSTRINKNLITERLLIGLNQNSKGRIVFIDRENIEMVDEERALKREGDLSVGAYGNADKKFGADFRLSGKIMSLDSIDNSSGRKSRYHQISFKMIDLETSALIWSGIYEFKKASTSNVVYR